MAIDLSDAMRNAGADSMLALLNVGGASTLKIFEGAKPASCAAADPVTVLSIHTMSVPAFKAANTGGEPVGQALANAIGDDTAANNSGTPGCFRVYNNAGACRFQGTAGVASGDISFATGIIQGLPVSITSLRFLVIATGP